MANNYGLEDLCYVDNLEKLRHLATNYRIHAKKYAIKGYIRIEVIINLHN